MLARRFTRVIEKCACTESHLKAISISFVDRLRAIGGTMSGKLLEAL
jgi:hypothetical protein